MPVSGWELILTIGFEKPGRSKLENPLPSCFDFQLRMTSQDVEVDIPVKYRHVGADGNGGDKAIDQLANSLAFPAACAVQSRRIVIVRRFRWQHCRKRKQTPECL